jgi:hypothetical protein
MCRHCPIGFEMADHSDDYPERPIMLGPEEPLEDEDTLLDQEYDEFAPYDDYPSCEDWDYPDDDIYYDYGYDDEDYP